MPSKDKQKKESTLIDSELGELSEEPEYLPGDSHKCAIRLSVCGCLLSILALSFVGYLLAKRFSEMPKECVHTDIQQVQPQKAASTAHVLVSGSFKIDDKHLKDTMKISWLPNENSSIVPSGDGGCLKVPENGKFLIISRFTFTVENDTDAGVFHFFTLLDSDGNMKPGGYNRNYVRFVKSESEQSKAKESNIKMILKYPSVFIEFFELKAGEQLCANVTHPQLLYVSKLDNDIIVIRM